MKKRIFAIAAILLCAAALFIYQYSMRFRYNDPSTLGNTSGNLLNGGLFCESGGKIYFSNPDDEGCLYVMEQDMSKIKKLSPDTVSHINIAGNYIYYARHNYRKEGKLSTHLSSSQAGLFRVTLSGKRPKTLSSSPVGTVSLLGNYVYYQNYLKDTGLPFYRCGINDREETLISDDAINPLALYDGSLYFSGVKRDHKIHKMNLTTKDDEIIFDANCISVVLNKDYLYFINLADNYSVCRVNVDGTNPVTLVREHCSTFNVSPSGRYLYYQADKGENSYLGQYDIQEQETTVIQTGSFSNINVCSDYVFFHVFDKSDEQYYFKPGSPDTVLRFEPGQKS